jgi:hypothetical protein
MKKKKREEENSKRRRKKKHEKIDLFSGNRKKNEDNIFSDVE